MRVIGTTAILLNRIRLVAVVGGNEVTNPFVVTEVYAAGRRVEIRLAVVHQAPYTMRNRSPSMKLTAKLVTIILALSLTTVFAADWPSLYGPRRNHTSEQKGLLRTWPQEGPKVLWTVPLSAGFGGPAVLGGNVYVLDRDEKVGDTLRMLELASGKELWTFAYEAPGSFMFAGSRTTPTVDGSSSTPSAAGRPVCHQHEDTEARLAQEHLEGLRRRRRAATMGDRAESADLR